MLVVSVGIVTETRIAGALGLTSRQRMTKPSFKRHRFPPQTIRYTIGLYARFTLSLRDVGEMLSERGVDVSYGRCQTKAIRYPKIVMHPPSGRELPPLG